MDQPTHSLSSIDLRGCKVLIVDDDRLNIRMLSGILKSEGYELAEAGSGEQALESYGRSRPDLVLLDVMMPGIDGFETCRTLKRTHGAQSAPVIFITAKNASDDVVEGLSAGGADYLPKPFNPKEVLARIRVHLRHQVLARRQALIAEQLAHVNAEKNRLLSMAADDLRVPLSSIHSLAQFLREGVVGQLTPDQLDLVDTIRTTSQSMLEMVTELLDIATIESGELKLHPEPTDLAELIAKSVYLANAAAAPKKTRIEFDPRGLAPVVTMDAAKMKQVIDNLLSNAVKYSPPGSIVTVEIAREETGGACSFTVKDQGPGIPENERDKLFKDFGRLSVKPTGGEKSTGLGLAICRKIVEAHRASIAAENLPLRGAAFRVVLPSSS